MGMCWGDIEEGVRIEVFNSDTNLSTKVYWIAEIIKLAGKITSHFTTSTEIWLRDKSTLLDMSENLIFWVLLF